MVGVLAFRVICWLRWVKAMLGIEKSVVIGPKVRNQLIPKTTSAPSMGRR